MRKNAQYGSLAPFLEPETLRQKPLEKIFGRTAPLEIEIGFGTGEYLVGLAARHPERNFLGFEQSVDRILKTLRKIHAAGLTNVRIMDLDAVMGFKHLLEPTSVEVVHCLFPCPWPKKRHAKNRLFSAGVLRLVNNRLVDKGVLKFVTDHFAYTDWIFENLEGTGFEASRRRIPPSVGTKFEKKWLEGGQSEFDEVIFRKVAHIELEPPKGEDMKTYFLESLDPANVRFEPVKGPISIQYRDFLFDDKKKTGMVLGVVTEEGRTQYLWMMVSRTSKGWCLSPAMGHAVLPTAGINQALEGAYQAFLRSAGQ